MKHYCVRLATRASLAAIMTFGFTTSAWALADLTDWVGVDNTVGGNNYSVTGPSTVGGTFAERRKDPASLSDQTLVDGPYQWNSTLSMSGTITFSAAPIDPVWFFGWYSSTPTSTTAYAERIGIGLADPIPAGTGIRFQTQSGGVPGTSVNSQNIQGTTAASTLAPGTYDFMFNYDGSGHMTGNIGTLNFARNYALPNNPLLNLDRFGILQKSGADDPNTFSLTISNITYTGETAAGGGTFPPGDFDMSHTVDAADLTKWQGDFGVNANSDANGDGVSDGGDFLLWQRNLGMTSVVAAASAVPEPATLGFALNALCFTALAARRRAA